MKGSNRGNSIARAIEGRTSVGRIERITLKNAATQRYVKKEPEEKLKAQRTTLPTAPCYKCASRGPCKHRSE